MKISLKWLNEFVDVKEYLDRPEPLAEILTKIGLEVEDIQDRGKEFNHVTVGLILDKQQHPNADKLSLCQVTTGEGVVHQIVCGAQNHKANDKVVVALPGAVLPGDFKIGRSVIRGVESGGMLCSLKELGLPGDSQGIIILPPDAPIGKSFAEYKGFNDVTFELKVTPNRADCLSHYGLAREVACVLGRPLKRPDPQLKESNQSTQKKIALQVNDPILCPRYAGRYLSGIKVGPSPDWLKARLESIGLNSINNVVDITNYVMMELGQPLHAFDAKELKGQKIIVEKSKAGETFTSLDGTEYRLSGDELLIKDGERAVAMAGVVGGKNSGVSDQTTEIFLEAAFFDPASVRRSSRRFGIVTDSGYRFVRGVDPEGTRLAMNRASELILQLAGGEAYGDVHDFYPQPVVRKIIKTTASTISERLGYACDPKLFQEWMTRLGCEIEHLNGEYTVKPPTFRFDLETEVDLVEEYARLTGYDQIPDHFPVLRKEPGQEDPFWKVQARLSATMRAHGYNQAINFAMTSEKGQSEFIKNENLLAKAGFAWGGQTVKLRNPLSDDINVMRKVLSYGLLKNAMHNFHQGQDFGALFEIGACFDQTQDKDETEYREENRIAGILWGKPISLWSKPTTGYEIFHLKAAIRSLFTAFGLPFPQMEQPENRGEIPSFLHRGQAAWIRSNGVSVGFAGAVHPAILDENKIRVPMAIFEIATNVFSSAKPQLQHYRPFGRFPTVVRDVALLMPQRLPAAQVISEILSVGGEILRTAQVFDVYSDASLGKGLRSVAFRLSFQDPKGTLQDQVVQDKMNTILASLKDKWQIAPR